jgi:hypothetical protein
MIVVVIGQCVHDTEIKEDHITPSFHRYLRSEFSQSQTLQTLFKYFTKDVNIYNIRSIAFESV